MVRQKTVTHMYCKDIPLVAADGQKNPILVRSTWSFKLKIYPDGIPIKFKARYCINGDLQRVGVDYLPQYTSMVHHHQASIDSGYFV